MRDSMHTYRVYTVQCTLKGIDEDIYFFDVYVPYLELNLFECHHSSHARAYCLALIRSCIKKY